MGSSNSLLILLLLAGVLLVFGIVTIFIIISIARRPKAKSMDSKKQGGLKANGPNAWEEAGKRISEDD